MTKQSLRKPWLFFQTIMYAGKEKETITQRKCRVYLKQKTKSSTNLIPDEGSNMEHLKRTNLQTYIWKQSLEQNMEMSSIEWRGWKDEEERINPVWFLVEQLPPCLSKKTKIKAKDGYIADSEEQEEDLIFKGYFFGGITTNCHDRNDTIYTKDGTMTVTGRW